MYYRVCERCGCNLDPGEKCDCTKIEKEPEHKQIKIKNIRNIEGNEKRED